MAASQITRRAYPRYVPGTGDNLFVDFRMKALDAFMNGISDGLVAKIQGATGLQYEEAIAALEAAYPIPIPTQGFGPATFPRVFGRMKERTIRGATLPWQAGMTEELNKLSRPGPVASVFSQPNAARQFGASGAALIDRLLVQRLLAGSTTTHGYDDANFFGTSKKIVPDDPSSPTYDNKFSATLTLANPVQFYRDVRAKVRTIKHPTSTTAAPAYIDQDVGGIMVSVNNFPYLDDLANKPDIRITVSGMTVPVVEANPVRNKFVPIESRNMPDNKAYVFTKGPGAQAGFLVHTLMGIETLPGGDFMAQEEWQQETGSWMMPRIWMLGENTEYARLNGKVVIGADMDADCILFSPWSCFEVDLTVS